MQKEKMLKIIIQKTSKPLPDGSMNPKVPPPEWWGELFLLLKDHETKILPDKLTWDEMKEMLDWCDTFISVDTYWPHFAWFHGKQGIVIWGQSDPLIFGHDIHINLLKDRKYLREHQHQLWSQVCYNSDVFVTPREVIECL